jgi:S-formylglutathione hydrolase FrmB
MSHLLLALILLSSSDSVLQRGRVESLQINSASLGVPKTIVVYLPPSYDRSARRYPVAYYLHGAGGNERNWVDRVGLDSIADSLAAAGLPQAVLVMPDGDSGYWMNWARPNDSPRQCRQDSLRIQTNESPHSYCVRHGRYEDFVVTELVRFIDSRYRTLADRQHRGIAGLSMGGYGAVWLAARHPELWSAVVSHSGVLSPLYVGPHPYDGHPQFAASVAQALEKWPVWRDRLFLSEFGSEIGSWWARDPLRQIRRLKDSGRRLPALYFDVGTEDRFVDQNRALDAALTRLNIAHRYSEHPGGHDMTYWRANAGNGLAWLLRAIGAANSRVSSRGS